MNYCTCVGELYRYFLFASISYFEEKFAVQVYLPSGFRSFNSFRTSFALALVRFPYLWSILSVYNILEVIYLFSRYIPVVIDIKYNNSASNVNVLKFPFTAYPNIFLLLVRSFLFRSVMWTLSMCFKFTCIVALVPLVIIRRLKTIKFLHRSTCHVST